MTNQAARQHLVATSTVDVAMPSHTLGEEEEMPIDGFSRSNRLTDYNIDANAQWVLDHYPQLADHQVHPEGCVPFRIVKELNRQLADNMVVRTKNGQIAQRKLAEVCGLRSDATGRHRDIIQAYDAAISPPTILRRVPEMRAWFQSKHDDGTLEVVRGLVNRLQFYQAFKCDPAVLKRYPNIRALFEEFDAKVAESNYQNVEKKADIEALQAYLKDAPELAKGSLKIKLAAIQRKIGITRATLLRSPFREMIEKAELSLRVLAKNDQLTVWLNRRKFEFRPLLQWGWSEKFLTRIAKSFAASYTTADQNVKGYFYSLCTMLKFLAECLSPACEAVRTSLNAGTSLVEVADLFTIARTQELRDYLETTIASVKSRNTRISQINVVASKLSNDGVLPPISSGIPSFNTRIDRHHLASVAEATAGPPEKSKTVHVDDYLHFATSMLVQAAELRDIHISDIEQSTFTRVLRDVLQTDGIKAAENPAVVILKVLDRRLDAIKSAALAAISRGRARIEEGKRLLQLGQDPGRDFDILIEVDRPEDDIQGYRCLLRNHFPVGDEQKKGLANVLAVVAGRFGSVVPGGTDTRLGRFMSKRAWEYGGDLQGYLMPSPETVSAIITLFLLATGANVSVGRTLKASNLQPSEEPKHTRLVSHKLRAGGKPIFATLEDRSDAVVNIKWLMEVHQAVPPSGDDLEMVFRAKMTSGFTSISEYGYREQFKKLVRSAPEIKGLNITPNMIRPSILLKAALESDGSTLLSRAIAQNAQGAHEGYVNKYPTRFLRDTDLRLFMYSMETVVISSLDEAQRLLGIDEEGMSRRVEAVMRTGLGTMCADRYGKPGNEGNLCQSLDCVSGCPQLILIAIPREIAMLQIWQHSLRLVEGDWVRDRPDRWEKIWLPWLCFCDAVEIKMRQTFSSVWRAATTISETLKANPCFQPMRLF